MLYISYEKMIEHNYVYHMKALFVRIVFYLVLVIMIYLLASYLVAFTYNIIQHIAIYQKYILYCSYGYALCHVHFKCNVGCVLESAVLATCIMP